MTETPQSEALLWTPGPEAKLRSNIGRYMQWLAVRKGLRFDAYEALWQWSVTEIEAFWASMWDFLEVKSDHPYTRVLTERKMPGAAWFSGVALNYVEHALAHPSNHIAVLAESEGRPRVSLTYGQLTEEVRRAAAGLRTLGVKRGDRVAAYMPNTPETLVAFLATASIGAVWSCCSPDFGMRSVVDRFQQIEPVVLITCDGYMYGGKGFDRLETVREIEAQLPSLLRTVVVPYLNKKLALSKLSKGLGWEELKQADAPLVIEKVPFDHPLWILYSSGTTGLPKPIVHGHGGNLIEHLKILTLHLDLGAEDRFFWFTTTGWMMWNFLVSGTLIGATIVLYDGNPGYPDLTRLWRLAEETGVTYFGTSAPFIQSCMKSGIVPAKVADLRGIRGLGSTGAPLTADGFRWVYRAVSDTLLLGSVSGGTDVCTAFVGSCPILPVYVEEIQCRCLGAKVEAFDDAGHPVINEVGELVVTEPLPSMPLYFWNDKDGRRYHESYFDMFPGVWRHGDWIKITRRGTCIIHGRSDSTLKRGGVRIGTAEFYRVVEELPEVQDSLIIDTGRLGQEGRLLLFLVLTPGTELNEELKRRINTKLRAELSPRHVPDELHAVPLVPKTLNGKKMEVPVKRILLGEPLERAVSMGSLADPQALQPFLEMAKRVTAL